MHNPPWHGVRRPDRRGLEAPARAPGARRARPSLLRAVQRRQRWRRRPIRRLVRRRPRLRHDRARREPGPACRTRREVRLDRRLRPARERRLRGRRVRLREAGQPRPGPDARAIRTVCSRARGRRIVADAASNSLLGVSPSGSISTLAVFPSRFYPQTGSRATDAVPDAVATTRRDGAYYVGELTGVPFTPGLANVWRVVPGQAPQVYCSGFSYHHRSRLRSARQPVRPRERQRSERSVPEHARQAPACRPGLHQDARWRPDCPHRPRSRSAPTATRTSPSTAPLPGSDEWFDSTSADDPAPATTSRVTTDVGLSAWDRVLSHVPPPRGQPSRPSRPWFAVLLRSATAVGRMLCKGAVSALAVG